MSAKIYRVHIKNQSTPERKRRHIAARLSREDALREYRYIWENWGSDEGPFQERVSINSEEVDSLGYQKIIFRKDSVEIRAVRNLREEKGDIIGEARHGITVTVRHTFMNEWVPVGE